MNYARRQQYRRLSSAGKAALGSVVAGLLGLVVASAGAAALGGLLLLVAVGLGLHARHWLSLAGRSRVGACSEDEVQRALAPLQAEGWELRHSLGWQGRGDIDSVAIAPTGIAVAIETKTRTYDRRHIARVREQAAWLSRGRRRWARNGALGVMCLVRARGVERVEHEVLVVSVDRLVHVVRVAAGMRPGAPSSGYSGRPRRDRERPRRLRLAASESPSGKADANCPAPPQTPRERNVANPLVRGRAPPAISSAAKRSRRRRPSAGNVSRLGSIAAVGWAEPHRPATMRAMAKPTNRVGLGDSRQPDAGRPGPSSAGGYRSVLPGLTF